MNTSTYAHVMTKKTYKNTIYEYYTSIYNNNNINNNLVFIITYNKK